MNKERHLKVYSSTQSKHTSYSHTEYIGVPMIRLQGQWLEAAGFHASDNILITIKENELVITKKNIDRP